MTVSKGIENMIGHVLWCYDCGTHLNKIRLHMIKQCKEKCQYCKRATRAGLCKEHMDWIYPKERF